MWPSIVLTLVYLWIGFTVGYFFRKWLQRAYLPRVRQDEDSGNGGDSAGPGQPRRQPRGESPAAMPAQLSGRADAPVEMVDWVDEQNRVIETLPRGEIRARNLLHRVTATFVFHPDGRILVHRRTSTKDVFPGFHDVSVGGTVTANEGYAQNAYRELSEEMGIAGVPLYELFRHRFQSEDTNSLSMVYACLYDGGFRFQASEVAAGDWEDLRRAEELIASGKVCPDSVARWRRYEETIGRGAPFALRARNMTPLPLP